MTELNERTQLSNSPCSPTSGGGGCKARSAGKALKPPQILWSELALGDFEELNEFVLDTLLEG